MYTYKNNSKEANEEQVLAAWYLLEAIRRRKNANWNNLEDMQSVMRMFAVELITQQPYSDKVIVCNQTVIKFPSEKFASKADYITYHSQDHNWGDDPLLFATFEALGYQPVMHLANTHLPPYVPFVQQYSDKPLRCDIVNHGAVSGGNHWEVKGKANPGNGNCMYYTMAQQVQQDYKQMLPNVDADRLFEVQENLTLSEVVVKPQQPARESNQVSREVQQQFAEIELRDQARKAEAFQILSTFSTADLAELYRSAMQHDGEYLTGRLKAFAEENGIEPQNNFLRNAVEMGVIDVDFKDVIREELLHALSVEAWRSPEHFNTLKTITAPATKAMTCAAEAGQEQLAELSTPRLTIGC